MAKIQLGAHHYCCAFFIQITLEDVLDMSDIEGQKEIEIHERVKLKRAKQDFELYGRSNYPKLFA